MQTTAEKLQAVEDAINRILQGGQKVKTRTAEVELASLNELRRERTFLEKKLEQERSCSGGIVRGYYEE